MPRSKKRSVMMVKNLTIANRILILPFCLVIFVFGVLTFSGCMVGPEYTRPETAADEDSGFYYSADHEQDVNALEIVDRWWEHFGDPVTASLVQEAIESNYDLKAAAARSL